MSQEPETEEWVLLTYQLPREPSTPRIALWRRLKRLGVVQLADGLVALPADPRTREQLEWLAEEVVQVDGSAAIWLARPASRAQQSALAERMASARAAEYAALAETAVAAQPRPRVERDKALKKLRRQWREVARRDFFAPPEREVAATEIRALAQASPVEPQIGTRR